MRIALLTALLASIFGCATAPTTTPTTTTTPPTTTAPVAAASATITTTRAAFAAAVAEAPPNQLSPRFDQGRPGGVSIRTLSPTTAIDALMLRPGDQVRHLRRGSFDGPPTTTLLTELTTLAPGEQIVLFVVRRLETEPVQRVGWYDVRCSTTETELVCHGEPRVITPAGGS